MYNTPFARNLAALAACGIILASCATPTPHKKKQEHKALNQQGLKALAILAMYLFPPDWDEAMGLSVAHRMLPLEYHGNAYQGKKLIQSKVEFDGGALQKLLNDIQKTTPSFTTSTDPEHPFGKDSDNTLDERGKVRELRWWRPDKHKNPTYYFWMTEHPNEPVTRIWLQSTDDKKGTKTVYVRIESE